MLTKNIAKIIATVCLPVLCSEGAFGFEYSGKIAVEERYFFEAGQYAGQFEHSQASLSIEPEFYWDWSGGSSSLTFQPYYRIDAEDSERTHGDVRELSYIYASEDWEFRAGIRKVFWGVTEFQHLVDVINQTDGVESSDGEDKLGQQMFNLSLVKNWGIVDLLVLPGFRERTFSGEGGRLRGPLVVDKSDVGYESGAEEQHVDLAVRWSHSLGAFDMGGYLFRGTNREPILTPVQVGEALVLRQYYNQMDQLGFDVQATLGDWLWKFESIYRDTDTGDFGAIQAGFEYTYVGVFESSADLGWLLEYGWDSRGEGDLKKAGSSFQNDLFLGGRFAFNDAQSSEVLVGFGTDLEHNASTFLIEASRRFAESFIATLDVRVFQSSDPAEPLYGLKDDDHLQLSLEWYF